MSDIASAAVPAPSSLPWGQWWRQVRAVLRLELRKGFRRSYGLYLLALAPLFILVLRSIIPDAVRDPGEVAGATEFYAGLYQAFILRIVIFLACVGIIIAARIYLNRPLDPEAEREFEFLALEARQRGCEEGRVGRDVE